jgi:hypothetical protein
MTLDFIMNPTAGFVELTSASYDLDTNNYLPENFLKDDNNLNRIFDTLLTKNKNKNINLLPSFLNEKPYIQKCTNFTPIGETNTKLEYEFECSTQVDCIYDFSLYFSNPSILSLNDILKIEVYTLNTLLEEISREFLVCWNRLYHQDVSPSDKTFYLPLFLNRYNLKHHNYSKASNKGLKIKISFNYPSNLELDNNQLENSLYLSYKIQLFTNKLRLKLIEELNSKDYYYYFDRICDYSFSKSSENKWLKLNNDSNNTQNIDLRFKEDFQRLTDLFIIIRNTNNNFTTDKKIVKSFSLYYEETCAFKLPAEVCGTLISPVSHSGKNNNNLTFAPEIKEVYYLPFSSNVELFKEYKPRSYLNMSTLTNAWFFIEFNTFDNSINLNNYELCLCYISPVKMKC